MTAMHQSTPDAGPHRSWRDARREQARRRRDAEIAEAAALGVDVLPARRRPNQTWTEAEDDVIRRHLDDMVTVSALTGRTIDACCTRRRSLGLMPQPQPWMTAEDKILRENARRARCARDLTTLLPGRTAKAVQARLRKLGLSIARPASDTGNAIVDAVKDRCRALGLTMEQLDRLAHTGRFWKQHGWKTHRRKTVMVTGAYARTLDALGGTLRVEWPDEGQSLDTTDG